MWIFDQTLFVIALRSAIIFAVVLVGMRLTGKREIGQMTPFDLVLLLLISNAVQNAMTGPDTSVTGGLVAAGTLFAANVIITRVTWRFGKARRFIEGTPTLLIHDGTIITSHLAKEKITHEELQQALREHGIARMEEVRLGVLEIDGSISILKKDELPVTRPHHRIRLPQKKPS